MIKLCTLSYAWVFFPTPSKSPPTSTSQLSSDTGDGGRSPRLKAQSHSTAFTPPHFRCQWQVQVVTCASDQTATDRKFHRPPHRVRLIYQSGSQNSERHFTYQITSVLSKDITQEQPDGRDAWVREWGKDMEIPYSLSAILSESPLVHQPRNSLNPGPLSFYGGFITQPWLIKSLATSN